MLDIKGLKIKIPGAFNDAFLYGDTLYLIDDDLFYAVDFKRLITTSISPDPEIRTLCKYAFLNNDFFYKADSDFYDFFNLPTIRDFLLRSYDKLRRIHLSKTIFKDCIIGTCKHGHRGAYHLEVYKNNIFISSDRGVFSYLFLNGKLMRESNLLPYPAYQINANLGNNVYFCCAENNLKIFNFDSMTIRRKLDTDKKFTIKCTALNLEFAYSDLVIRDINNNYQYKYDSLVTNEIDKRDYSFEDKLSAYEDIVGRVLVDARHIACNQNRMLKISDARIELYKLDYARRKEQGAALDEFFEPEKQWNVPRKIKEIHDGFQTVFGYILDTNIGTIVLDDNLNSADQLEAGLISKGENVKLRHFYRSINYSHLLLNIKDNYLDVYADLSDYFFPIKRKAIRRHITRRQAKGRY